MYRQLKRNFCRQEWWQLEGITLWSSGNWSWCQARARRRYSVCYTHARCRYRTPCSAYVSPPTPSCWLLPYSTPQSTSTSSTRSRLVLKVHKFSIVCLAFCTSCYIIFKLENNHYNTLFLINQFLIGISKHQNLKTWNQTFFILGFCASHFGLIYFVLFARIKFHFLSVNSYKKLYKQHFF